MKKTNYGAQYDLVSLDDVRELAQRRASDKVRNTPAKPDPYPMRSIRHTLARFAVGCAVIIIIHLLIFIHALTRE